MWKATTKTVVLAVAMVGLGTGCDLSGLLNNLQDAADELNERDGTDVPDEPREDEPGDDEGDWADPNLPDDVPDDHDICPEEPWDPTFECELQLDECLQAGLPEDECFYVFEECLDDSWEDPTDPWFGCEVELEECLDAGIDEDVCFTDFDQCIGPEEPWPYEECELDLEICLDGVYGNLPDDPDAQDFDYDLLWEAEEACWIAYDECVGWVEPPPYSPCDELFDFCLATGVSDELCEQVYDECNQNEPGIDPIDPCEEVVDDCFANGDDPETCDAILIDCYGDEPGDAPAAN